MRIVVGFVIARMPSDYTISLSSVEPRRESKDSKRNLRKMALICKRLLNTRLLIFHIIFGNEVGLFFGSKKSCFKMLQCEIHQSRYCRIEYDPSIETPSAVNPYLFGNASKHVYAPSEVDL